MENIRLGTIGSGMIVHAILDRVKLTEGIQLEAVYSRSAEKGRELAREYGARKVYTDLSAMLRDPNVDLIYVASPNSLHYDHVRMALEAGKHVLCEKPMCPLASQVRALMDLAKSKNRILIPGVPLSFAPNLEILREQLPRIGRIRLVQANFSKYSGRYDLLKAGQMPNVFSPDFAGGCLMDINFYNLYLNVLLFGKPEKAVYYPNVYPGAVDTSGILMLQYADFVSECTGAKDTWGENFFQIQGENGYLRVEGSCSEMARIRLVTRQEEHVLDEQPDGDHWLYEVRGVISLLQEMDLSDAEQKQDTMLQTMEVLEDARKAAGIRFSGD